MPAYRLESFYVVVTKFSICMLFLLIFENQKKPQLVYQPTQIGLYRSTFGSYINKLPASEDEEHTYKNRKIKYEIFNLLWTINE